MDQPYLDINNAGGRRQLVLRDEAITIGRHADNKLVLADHMASRFHCVIERRGAQFVLRDLGASNGTRVNGQLVRTVALAPGDVVTIGSTNLVLVLPGTDFSPGVASAVPDDDATEEIEELTEADMVEELTEADLVQDIEELDLDNVDRIPLLLDDSDEEIIELDNPLPDVPTGAPPTLVQGGLDDYESRLWSMAEAQTDRFFGEADIAILDCKGQVQHAAGKPIGPGERQPPDVLRLLLLLCFRSRATDIHMEPREGSFHCRIRVDGVMVDVCDFPASMGTRIGGVVKVLCQIDTSQRNIVQEGHFAATSPGRDRQVRRVDYRVSFAPAVTGQKLVVRVLDPTTAPAKLADLVLPKDLEEALNDAIEQDSGMVLVCGPTGSGKTSTLYALVRSIDVQQRNVVTIEDPVEIRIENATQIPVDEEKGNTFPTLLRSVLRQDPDVILVGEIRDAETARVAMQASITGHLVFSTVHTKDALGTVYRLLDLGVEPYLLAQGLQVIIAQRLVRRLCPACKRATLMTPEQRTRIGPQAEGVTHLYTPVGCARCLGTGYHGRLAFFEMLRATDDLRDAISHSPSGADLRKALEKSPFTRLIESGRKLAFEGLAALDEVEKAVGR
ncbi:ATPase, T2SS/T4P/T4SS family [Humisphaera borealis]|uniref:Flp pilus assembly complex ATPase component TadA n=1 Tax=Humisphaera borealis TaxID=2807512 RepID=A0A7M2WTD8_9BACT|nr:ATPase, T2SS/T4P/T4SS family [Humisphaera borealis]QOV88524.1 Flp pilus assembly complex ATPase component TadA [Humisphaera borealis]